MIKRVLYLIFVSAVTYIVFYFHESIIDSLATYRNITQHPQKILVFTPDTSYELVPTREPSATPPLVKKTQQKTNGSTQSTHPEEAWGVAKEIGEGTYTIRVANDSAMGSPQEVFTAVNNYRNVNGSSTLSWDDNLAAYAQSRADYMASIKNTDKHAGFNNFLENEEGFNKLGFSRLGENSYYGGMLNGVHVIEWVFAKSPGHDANQKDNVWSNVGIGVTNSTVDLIFGGSHL